MNSDPDIGVVVPTVSDDVLTLDSIPSSVSHRVERTGTLNEARNRGVANTEREVVAILDDDITFSEATFWHLAQVAAEGYLVGMADWDFGLVAGRFMFFPKELWRDVGGFDERLRSHMGDTDFAIRAERAGWPIHDVPQVAVDHDGPPGALDRVSTFDRLWRVGYLTTKYPSELPRIATGMVQ
jgi:GT2 family glycosyltransferase